jgi:hypothetical protein
LLPAAALAATAAGEAAVERDRRLTPREEAKLLAPLLRLRQACCHPQVPHTLQYGVQPGQRANMSFECQQLQL